MRAGAVCVFLNATRRSEFCDFAELVKFVAVSCAAFGGSQLELNVCQATGKLVLTVSVSASASVSLCVLP
jgi:hypothetical protein